MCLKHDAPVCGLLHDDRLFVCPALCLCQTAPIMAPKRLKGFLWSTELKASGCVMLCAFTPGTVCVSQTFVVLPSEPSPCTRSASSRRALRVKPTRRNQLQTFTVSRLVWTAPVHAGQTSGPSSCVHAGCRDARSSDHVLQRVCVMAHMLTLWASTRQCSRVLSPRTR